MKVAFDSRPARDFEDVGRYTRSLLDALRETAEPGRRIEETHDARRADVFHAPWMDGAMLHSPCPMVVTLHDLAALRRRSELLRTGVRPALRRLAVQRAARVIAPTEAVAREALTRFGIERERIDVIHEAPAASMYPRDAREVAAVRARFALPDRYLLWVGGLRHPDPDKHVDQLAATPHELALVLVGPTSPWAHELPGVILTGHVCDDDLAALYTGAHALVIAAESEGSGRSAVEALACATPVVACEGPALREVLDGRVEFVPACDTRSLIAAAQSIAREAPTPPAWTGHDAARATWRCYERALVDRSTMRTAGRRRRRRAPSGSGRALAGPQ